MTPVVEVLRTGRMHRITLNRPGAGNAIDQELAEGFLASVRGILAEDEPQIVVLTGAGTRFCAGGDVRAVATAADPRAYLNRLAATMHEALDALRESPHVVVAAVNGVAAGAGLALVLNADLVIASKSAVFLSAYADVGLTPDCGVSHLLPRTVGPRRAAELAITGRALDAAEARTWGLVNDVVSPAELDAAVDALVSRLAAIAEPSSRTLALMRREDLSFASHLDAELAGLDTMIARDDTHERMHRFLDRTSEKTPR